MISMILASTFCVPMVVFSIFFLVSFLEMNEPTCKLGDIQPKLDMDLAEEAIMNILDFVGELPTIEDSREFWMASRQWAYAPSQDASPAEMPASEFENLVWAVTLPNYAALAASLLSRPKPQRGKDGKFIKKVRVEPDLQLEQVEGMAPIPSLFSFFKASYQPQLNKLIHKVQQFLATPPSIITAVSSTYQTTPQENHSLLSI